MARSFNGSTDELISSSIAIPVAATMAIWVKPITLPSGYQTVCGYGGANDYFVIHLKSTGNAAYYCFSVTGGIHVDPGTATYTLNAWTHTAITYDSINNLLTYANGISDGTNNLGFGNLGQADSPLGAALGYDTTTPGRHLNGVMADFGYWNTALTVAEIRALANGARPGNIRPQNLLCWQPLDGLQSPEPDLSGKKNNGTLTGTTAAFGPPLMQFTPRWPQFTAPVAAVVTPSYGFNIPMMGFP
jgi:hypothetical protein